PPFGKSWQDWKDAVKSGALFYDGDFDGVYNPVDKNLNGIWDTNEDMPYLLGDITVWSVYNDSEAEQNRRIENTYPVGIEIQQTAFASSESHLRNTIFIMYSIINRGLISDSLNNVYFSIWADPDIGHHEDDLVGCDTTIFSSYTFNDGSDSEIGDDPPALFLTYLQGPKVVDTTMGGFQFQAINNFGFYYGVYVYEGYRNLKPSSFQNNIPFQNPFFGDETKSTFYNRILGLRPEGVPVDPCNFNQGIVIPDTLCDEVNPLFLFSGDPVNNNGWINTVQKDQHNLYSIGPFNLFKNEPEHIIIAYTGGKGDNALNSITVGKELVQGVIHEYNNNFPSLTYQSGEPYFPITKYILHQNYPNPFNPGTIISWQSPVGSWQTIKVFDVLGREVATLIDEYREAGYHEVEFNSAGLASGVYYYQLKAGSYVQTKKMIYLK
ncbi:MAG: T9SS type A sorting domain-containing protein, partial [Ignavibacteriaceae bacterium]